MIPAIIAVAVLGYLLGSIPAGLIVGRVYRRIDIREFGSGRIGSTNTLRTLGPGAALVVLASDLAKGAVPVLIARLVSDEPYVQIAGGASAVVGHIWPLYVGFRGGRGVATAAGALCAMLPWMAPVLVVTGLVLLLPFRYVSLMSIGGAPVATAVVLAVVIHGDIDHAYAVYAAFATVLILVLHKDNIFRLLAGTEPKLGQGGQRRSVQPAARH